MIPQKLSDEVEVHGPFTDGTYKVAWKGKLVPHLTVQEGLSGIGLHASTEEEERFVIVTIDGRMGWWISRDTLGSVLGLCANAMAVAAGFACFGGPRLDPFGAPPTIAALPRLLVPVEPPR